MTSKKKDFKDLDEASIEKLIRWVKLNSATLEKGFFYFEEKDKELAEKVSTTLFIFERTV